MTEILEQTPLHETDSTDRRRKILEVGSLAVLAALSFNTLAHASIPHMTREREPKHIEYATEIQSAIAPDSIVHPGINGAPGQHPEVISLNDTPGRIIELQNGRVLLR